MKIRDIEFKEITLPLLKPFQISLATVYEITNILVRITTDDGLSGVGEAAPFFAVLGDSLEHVKKALEMMKPALIGEDPYCLEKIHRVMDSVIFGNSAAKAAIDIAVHDLLGKKAGLPLYRLLGGGKDTFETDMTVGIDSPEAMAEEAHVWVQKGFRTLKIKVGDSAGADIARIAAIREAVGSEVVLRLDANQGWHYREALEVIERIRKFNIELIEQPLRYDDLEHMRLLREHSDIAIMADESVHGPGDALHVIKQGACDFINIKLMKSGGLYPALAISDICAAAHIECMIGCMVESKIAITAAASLAAARNIVTKADVDSYVYFSDDLIGGGLSVSEGIVKLPEKPGLGISIDW